MPTSAQRGFAALLATLIALPMVLWAGTAPAAAEGPTQVALHGHGFGHGRGMGQYGAKGYAQAGQSAAQILDHYYGGTTSGTVADNGLKVLLCDLEGVTICTSGPGLTSAIVTSTAPFSFEGVLNAFPANTAIRVSRTLDGTAYQVERADGGCSPGTFVPVGGGTTSDPVIDLDPGTAPLRVCAPKARSYRGGLKLAMQGTKMRMVNFVGVGDYLKGVVPSEMPSSWAPEALKVQAVAARSYAMAGDNRFPGFADTCDTVQCQVYKGIDAEKPSTSAAVDQTAGVVRMANGAIARTEFSASTGGYTAGGTFPAVVDDGDSVSDNPYHDWDVTIPATTIESAYPTIGDFQAIQVTKRNGLGAEGGRVTQAKIIGSAATVTTTGDDVRSKLGLRSDWFAPGTGFARIAAADRYATAAAIATSTFTTTDTAIVARGDGPTSFPDSLAANYLGGTLAVPTLLATSTSVPDVTLTTLQQLGVKNVRLLGGTSALSEGVATALTNAGYSVTRISGADRFVTAAAIATTPDQGGIGTIEGQRTAVLSSGETFPDALAAGGIVYRNHYPQLLTLAGSLPQSTSTALTQLGIKHVLITGGTSAVSDAVEQAVKGLGITTERLAGATRYDTAAAIANASVDRLNFSNTTVDVATGETFPDALTGGSHAGRSQAPILLTAPGSVPQATCAFLTKWKATITVGRVFGGTSAVADSTVSALRACLT